MSKKKISRRISVIGDGSWGTAIARFLALHNHDVCMWGISEENIQGIKDSRINKMFLPGIELPANLMVSHRHEEVNCGAEIVIFAVPSQYARQTLTSHKDSIPKDAVVLNISKGIEKGTLMRLSEVILDVLGEDTRVATLSGPTIASEVVAQMPTLAVVASEDGDLAKSLQKILSSDTFRVYISDDLVGVELGGSLKNVIALAGGIADGCKFGSNTKAAIVARGLDEMTRLALAMGAKRKTLMGISGVGDLVTTCFGSGSRNRTFGEQLTTGKKPSEILLDTRSVVEGVETTRSAYLLGLKYGVAMPITNSLYEILYEDKDPRLVFSAFMKSKTVRE